MLLWHGATLYCNISHGHRQSSYSNKIIQITNHIKKDRDRERQRDIDRETYETLDSNLSNDVRR